MIATKRVEAGTENGASDNSGPGPRRMLGEKQVLQIVPVGRTTLYRMEKAGRFPKGTYISPNRRVWFEDEIVAWQNAVDEFDPSRCRGKGRRRRAPRVKWASRGQVAKAAFGSTQARSPTSL